MAGKSPVRIRGGITTSNLLFVPSPRHGLISLVPWDSTASVADLETAAVNSPRILSGMEGSPVVAAARGVGAFLHSQELRGSDGREGKRGGRLAPAARRQARPPRGALR